MVKIIHESFFSFCCPYQFLLLLICAPHYHYFCMECFAWLCNF